MGFIVHVQYSFCLEVLIRRLVSYCLLIGAPNQLFLLAEKTGVKKALYSGMFTYPVDINEVNRSQRHLLPLSKVLDLEPLFEKFRFI